MLELRGFRILERVHRGTRSSIFRAEVIDSATRVILKTATSEEPAAKTIMRLEREAALLTRLHRSLDGKASAIVKLLDVQHAGSRPVLVLEDIKAPPASARVDARLPTRRFLQVAQHAARALAAMHSEGVLHNAIRPDNLLLPDGDVAVKLIDFGTAVPLLRLEAPLYCRSRVDEMAVEDAGYSPPECFGVTGDEVDVRSDLYSLGAVLYELLGGSVPLPASTAHEVIMAHLGRSVQAFPSNVPEALAAIVTRLLAKEPGDRYQSAQGVCSDLTTAWESLHRDGQVATFFVGERDEPLHPCRPRRFYGRRKELATVAAALERIAAGPTELLVLEGGPGSGKSALLKNVVRMVSLRGGRALYARCDDNDRYVPYSGLVQCLRPLFEDYEAAITFMPAEEADRLLDNRGTLAAVFRPFEDFGDSPTSGVVSMWGAYSERKLLVARAFRSLLQRFASPDGPLVLLLDDLHRADRESLELVHWLLHEGTLASVAVIAAIDGEVSPGFAASLVDSHQLSQLDATSVTIAPLLDEHLASWVSESFSCTFDRARPLAEWLNRKSSGAPLQVYQHLRVLEVLGLMSREGFRQWQWDTDVIEQQEASVDEAIGKLLCPPDNPMLGALLMHGAEAGDCFDVDYVCHRSGGQLAELAPAIETAIREGWLLPSDGCLYDLVATHRSRLMGAACRFSHASVYRNLRARTANGNAPVIEEALVARWMDGPDGRGFSGLGAWRWRAMNLLCRADVPEALRDDVARELERVGDRCLRAGGLNAAHLYFERSRELAKTFDFTVALRAYACQVVIGDADTIVKEGLALLKGATSKVERAASLTLVIPALAQRAGLAEQAIRLGRATLAEFGVELWPSGHADDLEEMHRQLADRIGPRGWAGMSGRPPMTDDDQRHVCALLDVLSVFAVPVARPTAVAWVAGLIVLLTLEHGVSPASGPACAEWGSTLAHERGEFSSGFALGRVAVACAYRARVHRARTHLICASSTEWLGAGFDSAVDHAREAFALAVDEGQERVAIDAAVAVIQLSWSAGMSTLETGREAASLREILERRLRVAGVTELLTAESAVDQWQSDETTAGPSYVTSGGPRAELFGARLKLEWHCIHREAAEAMEASERADAMLSQCRSHLTDAELPFYAGLALTLSIETAASADRPPLRHRLGRHVDALQTWVSGGAVDSLGAKSWMLRAESLRIDGEGHQAEEAYESAIAAAEAAGNVGDVALSNELAARHYLRRGLRKAAVGYLLAARDAYVGWGGVLKSASLSEEFAELFSHAVALEASGSVPPRRSLAPRGTLSLPTMIADLRDFPRAPSARVLESALARAIVTHGDADWVALVEDGPEGPHVRVTALRDAGSIEIDSAAPQSAIAKVPSEALRAVFQLEDVVWTADAAVGESTDDAAQIYDRVAFPLGGWGRRRRAVFCERWGSRFSDHQVAAIGWLCSEAARAWGERNG